MADKIYILGCNQTGPKFYFTDLELARKVLGAKANKVKYSLGVNCFKYTFDEISWVSGWEEVHVSWSIREAPITSSLKEIEGIL